MEAMTEFARFVEEQLPRLRAYVARMPGAQRADVEDLLQDALLRAYEARERFQSDEHAVNWICQVVRNLLVDRHRRWSRRQVLPHADLDDVGEPAPDPADLVVAAEQATLAVRALTRLPQSQRDLLWEHVVDGVSYADIARRTATPLATVRSLAHRARLAAVREFAQAGGALSVLPAFALRPWRRFTHKIAGLPSTAYDALAMAGAVAVAVAMPIGALPGVPPATTVTAGAPHSHGVATAPAQPRPRDLAVAITTSSGRPAAPAATPPPSDTGPKELVQSVQSGTFSGTYSSDCTFATTDVRVLDSYDCRFSATSNMCQIKLRGASTTSTGCVLELLSTRVTGLAASADGLGAEAAARHCWSGGSGAGKLRFRTSPGSRPIVIPVTLVMGESEVDVSSDNVRVLGLSGSFPFACSVPHQQSQIGFHGTLGY